MIQRRKQQETSEIRGGGGRARWRDHVFLRVVRESSSLERETKTNGENVTNETTLLHVVLL